MFGSSRTHMCPLPRTTDLTRSSENGESPRRSRVEPVRIHQRPAYDALLASCPWSTVFHELWWLEVAANGHETEVLGCWDESGRLVGALPFVKRERLGLRIHGNPNLTPYLGPVIAVSSDLGPYEYNTRVRQVSGELLQAVSDYDLFNLTCAPGFLDPFPAIRAGMDTHLGSTFRIRCDRVADFL